MMIDTKCEELLKQYATTSRVFSKAVEGLQCAFGDMEAFIKALDQTGTARRACEQSRIRLDKYLAGRVEALR